MSGRRPSISPPINPYTTTQQDKPLSNIYNPRTFRTPPPRPRIPPPTTSSSTQLPEYSPQPLNRTDSCIGYREDLNAEDKVLIPAPLFGGRFHRDTFPGHNDPDVPAPLFNRRNSAIEPEPEEDDPFADFSGFAEHITQAPKEDSPESTDPIPANSERPTIEGDLFEDFRDVFSYIREGNKEDNLPESVTEDIMNEYTDPDQGKPLERGSDPSTPDRNEGREPIEATNSVFSDDSSSPQTPQITSRSPIIEPIDPPEIKDSAIDLGKATVFENFKNKFETPVLDPEDRDTSSEEFPTRDNGNGHEQQVGDPRIPPPFESAATGDSIIPRPYAHIIGDSMALAPHFPQGYAPPKVTLAENKKWQIVLGTKPEDTPEYPTEPEIPVPNPVFEPIPQGNFTKPRPYVATMGDALGLNPDRPGFPPPMTTVNDNRAWQQRLLARAAETGLLPTGAIPTPGPPLLASRFQTSAEDYVALPEIKAWDKWVKDNPGANGIELANKAIEKVKEDALAQTAAVLKAKDEKVAVEDVAKQLEALQKESAKKAIELWERNKALQDQVDKLTQQNLDQIANQQATIDGLKNDDKLTSKNKDLAAKSERFTNASQSQAYELARLRRGSHELLKSNTNQRSDSDSALSKLRAEADGLKTSMEEPNQETFGIRQESTDLKAKLLAAQTADTAASSSDAQGLARLLQENFHLNEESRAQRITDQAATARAEAAAATLRIQLAERDRAYVRLQQANEEPTQRGLNDSIPNPTIGNQPKSSAVTPASTNVLLWRVRHNLRIMVHERAIAGIVQGDNELAVDLAAKALIDSNALGDPSLIGRSSFWAGVADYYAGDMDSASSRFNEASQYAWEGTERQYLELWQDICKRGIEPERDPASYRLEIQNRKRRRSRSQSPLGWKRRRRHLRGRRE